jgi:uncharacterized phage-like protein YoqJ
MEHIGGINIAHIESDDNFKEKSAHTEVQGLQTVASATSFNVCEMCGKHTSRLDSHHTIPRYIGGDDRDIIQVCKSCHIRADKLFAHIIVNPFKEQYLKWKDDKKKKLSSYKYRDTFLHYMHLFSMSPEPKVQVRQQMSYNSKLNTIYISYNFSRSGKGYSKQLSRIEVETGIYFSNIIRLYKNTGHIRFQVTFRYKNRLIHICNQDNLEEKYSHNREEA